MPERRRGVRAVDRDRGTWWQALAARSLLLRLAALALLIVAYVAVKMLLPLSSPKRLVEPLGFPFSTSRSCYGSNSVN